jgi:serine/threonine-protein phosphatase 2B catalytic subunit
MGADLLREEPNCVEVDAPCNVFGDVHGQYFDLLQLIKQAGVPSHVRQLWLGDYVDRGNFGCEVVLLLVAAKVKWPKSVFLLRGNHESRSQTHVHNFELEATTKYGAPVYDLFMALFDTLPLAAVVTSVSVCLSVCLCAHVKCLSGVCAGARPFLLCARRAVPHDPQPVGPGPR